ncbi:DUF5018 domain-containing protein, partial [Bacteroidales bacterium OttesenSCG-928-J19]|nr:DUF5018 domain-containing protein [Bacteroidales bacterium OttesenSCG-928-J19]
TLLFLIGVVLSVSAQEAPIAFNIDFKTANQTDLELEGWEFSQASFSSDGMELAKRSVGGMATTPLVNSPSEISMKTKNKGDGGRIIEVLYLKEEAWISLGTYTVTSKNEETFSFELEEKIESTRFRILSQGGNPVVFTSMTIYGEKPISTEALILGFSLPGQIGSEVIDEETKKISLQMPLSADLNLAPNFFIISAGATVNPDMDTPQDFNQVVTYTVTAEDGVTKADWNVEVERVASSEKEITSFQLAAEQLGSTLFNKESGTIQVKVPNTLDVSNLVPLTFHISSGAMISPAMDVPQDFSKPVTYMVTAEDGTSKPWSVNVTLVDPNEYIEIDFNKVVGWASAKGGPKTATNKPASNVEINTTTGGLGGEVYYFTPDQFDDLCVLLYERINYKYAENKPVIIVMEPGVWDGSISSTEAGKVFSNNMLTIQEQGDITLLGKGNVQCKFGINIKRSYNIIIRNIYFWGYQDDAINVGEEETHHVWIDHCTAGAATQSQTPSNKDAVDGTFEVKNGASYVTVSWCVTQNHWKSCLIGHSDGNGGTDEGRLKVTHYANYYNNTYSRHPRVRFGQVHVLNCMYENAGWGRETSYKPASSIGMGYGCAASNNSEVFVENCFFFDTQFPFYADRSKEDYKALFGLDKSSTGNKPCTGLRQSGNAYDDSGLTLDLAAKKGVVADRLNPGNKSIKFDELNPNAVFNPGEFYTYDVLTAEQVRETVPAYAGSGVLSWDELAKGAGITGGVSLDTPQDKPSFRIYSGNGQVTIQGLEGGESIALYTVSGVLLQQVEASASSITLSGNWQAGVYLVKVDGISKKIIIQ